jgi:eukaryotic-like serine/threonine-protein kinase
VQAIKPTDLATAAGYVLTGILSENDLGTTYVGTDAHGHQVAVWVLRDDLFPDAQAREGFVRHMRLATNVMGSCTTRVLAVGTENDRAYVVSQYVEGPTLDEAVRQGGPQSGAALSRLAVSTATALTAIHRVWISHGDLKPANVILGPDGPLVAGYGVADALEPTAEGMFGTPAYLSPEQISRDPAGSAADIFAWASTMVFAATGRPPFHGETWDETLRQVARGAPDLGSIDDPFRQLVASCLEKDPAERPTADQLLQALPRTPLPKQRPLPAPPFPPKQRPLPASSLPSQQPPPGPSLPSQQPPPGPPLRPQLPLHGLLVPPLAAAVAAQPPVSTPAQTSGPPHPPPAPPALPPAAPLAPSDVPPRAPTHHGGGGKNLGAWFSEAWDRSKMWVPVGIVALVAAVTAVALVLTASPGHSHAPAAETGTQRGTNPVQQATGSTPSGQQASAQPHKSASQAPTPDVSTSPSSKPTPKRKPAPAGTPEPTGPSLAGNGSFEAGQLAPWMDTANSVVTDLQADNGTHSAAMHSTGTGAGVAQDLTGLTPGTTYQLTGWVMSSVIVGDVYLGVRDYNEAMTTSQATASTSWTFESMTFTPVSDTAQIWCWRLAAGYGYCDNISVRAMRK